MKFERYVFVAFFAVISLLAVAGLVQFQRNQEALAASRGETLDAQAALRAANTRQDAEKARLALTQSDHEKALAESKERESRRCRDLGAALVQLAMLESEKGTAARARGLAMLDEALRFGAPPYLPLARWALLDASRATALTPEKGPFSAASTSPDSEWLAISRGQAGIEVYGPTSSGKPIRLPVAQEWGEATALALSNECLFAGFSKGSIVRFDLGGAADLAGRVVCQMANGIRLLSLSEAGLRLASLDQSGNLRVAGTTNLEPAQIEAAGQSLICIAALDAGETLAVGLESASGQLKLFSQSLGHKLVDGLGHEPVQLGALKVIGRELFVAQSAAGVVRYRRSLMPSFKDEDNHQEGRAPGQTRTAESGATSLAFAPDGALLAGYAQGRVREYDFSSDEGTTFLLGGEADLNFLARWRDCTFGISADRIVSLRQIGRSRQEGRSILLLEPADAALVSSQGFAIPSRRMAWPRLRACWLEVRRCELVSPTAAGYVATSGSTAWFFGGNAASPGVLLSGFFSGAALFRGPKDTLAWLKPDGQLVTLISAERFAPDLTLAAANSDLALLRGGNITHLVEFSAPDSILRSRQVPDVSQSGPLAIDASGTRIASCKMESVRITSLNSLSPDTHVALQEQPIQLALLFEGTVLCALHPGQLSFYDTQSGRELLRRSTSAKNMAASDDELFLVCPDGLRVLRFK